MIGRHAPHAKALVPVVLSIVLAGIAGAAGSAGTSWKVLLGGALSGITTYLVPNKPKPPSQ